MRVISILGEEEQMPVINFPTVNDVPEGLKEFAKESEDGSVSVNVVANEKLAEFREKNIELSKQLEASSPILARVRDIAGEDLDAFVDEVKELRSIAQRVQDGELKTDDQIEKAIQDRIKVIREGYDENNKRLNSELAEERNKAKTLHERLDRARIERDVTFAFTANQSVQPHALPDVIERAYRLFKVEDDRLVPKRGDSVIFGADGASPMTPAEWLEKLKDEAPHYFKPSSGGGAAGGKEGGTNGFSEKEIAGMTARQRLDLANKTKAGIKAKV